MLKPDFLDADRVRCDVEASSRKDALQSLSSLLAGAPVSLTASEIYELLDHRERLGSTCLGNGVAIPHGRAAQLESPVAALLLLTDPVDFDAGENSEVSVVLGILLPEDDHSDVAQIARALRQDGRIDGLRHLHSPAEAVALLNVCLERASVKAGGD